MEMNLGDLRHSVFLWEEIKLLSDLRVLISGALGVTLAHIKVVMQTFQTLHLT
jgi:hypothetical protein